jgi:peptidoglycan/LPS O-acetylase OafA/YrhL
MPVVIAGLFWGLIKEKTLLQRFLSTKLMQVLGKSSYTLYLIHYSFFSYLIQKYISSNTIIVIIIIQVAAILIWHFVEEPLNLSIRSHFRSHPPSVAKPGTLSV